MSLLGKWKHLNTFQMKTVLVTCWVLPLLLLLLLQKHHSSHPYLLSKYIDAQNWRNGGGMSHTISYFHHFLLLFLNYIFRIALTWFPCPWFPISPLWKCDALLVVPSYGYTKETVKIVPNNPTRKNNIFRYASIHLSFIIPNSKSTLGFFRVFIFWTTSKTIQLHSFQSFFFFLVYKLLIEQEKLG